MATTKGVPSDLHVSVNALKHTKALLEDRSITLANIDWPKAPPLLGMAMWK